MINIVNIPTLFSKWYYGKKKIIIIYNFKRDDWKKRKSEKKILYIVLWTIDFTESLELKV